ncbi:MAG: macrocin O-methyltransferase, partial [Candidatus Pacebacteria bacterium]|nr:macrocin O-methyltransferase [Candidatus Paceibacterota bacterium]
FAQDMLHHGLPPAKFFTVKGFYDNSLTPALKEKLLPKKAAVIYIDCDLYASTVPVLEFTKDFLQKGTIIVFDDWNCFCGDPKKGERLAFRQFREKYPHLRFEEFVQTNEGKAFIFLGEDNKQ